ncbi:uncharacterized protein SEPMUDRAFT_165565 [Sphaerulina musiva SO2202]|uniref:Aminoglycoside phosphotransferase domain-containing protein n=1 Tax=Sphaerulina musiva (strain SO2202) TaxID=692275 RepID=M3CYR6_SPHMS|nr:uncharacterized protein SEPMUDRAFT_165565 [Sphaerulina musiva SO2202]EMF09799.1 hypothetical protein SEPMUDRAFT_165565 [Sphaerulina musiva SO2202]
MAVYSLYNELLCDRVVSLSPGATAVRSWRKKEGGFNRIFIMNLDSGSKLVAEIPYPGVGLPQRRATVSEVATNPVECEYIIMTEARGVLLSGKWPQMTGPQRVGCISPIFQNVKQLQDLEFPAYGSLYFHEEISLISTKKFDLDCGICLSQYCGIGYWDSDSTSRAPIHRGPWRDLQGFADSLVDVGIARVPTELPTIASGPPYQGLPQEHRDMLTTALSIFQAISTSPSVQKASKPLLYHPDLHARNIFVSEHTPTLQGTSVEPAFWHADVTPDFAHPNDETSAKTCAVYIAVLIPKLAAAQRVDENIFRPYQYCFRTWKDGIPAYRHELAETWECWNEMNELRGVDRPQQQQQTDVKFIITQDKRAYDLFVTAQMMKTDFANLLNCETDGWVRAETYEATKKKRYHDKLFHGALHAVLDDANDSEETTKNEETTFRALWPF